ncbi:MAG: enolase C-terminal domain-like protein [Chloroflexota bacterium]|nr:enolase C-terminal domain-like protein [Chloroflexota bacterium]
MLHIESIQVVTTRPTTENLVLVKVQTSEPGLYGWGCATFTQRYKAVVETVTSYLEPLLVGRDPARIGELWRLMQTNGYWRNGPVLNNAISGVDQALWDIKGKQAGMPVYDLLGGKVREAAAVYQHAAGRDAEELCDRAKSLVEQGVRHVRVQLSKDPPPPGTLAAATAGYGGASLSGPPPDGALSGHYFDSTVYRRTTLDAIARLRERLGEEVELLHDVHSRLSPADAVDFARRLEPFRLFFLEDALPPEHLDWYERMRAATTTPQAVGELFVHPAEWLPLVAGRRIDFLRLHLSAIGGLTPAWRAAQVCETHGVRTAWHGPKDVSPVGHAAQLHLDVASYAFGIQEYPAFSQPEVEIFDGLPELREGYLYPSDRPGLGIEVDEAAAARYPARADIIEWTQARYRDGSLSYP